MLGHRAHALGGIKTCVPRVLRKSLKAKRDAREIPSLSVALMEQAPQVVGTDLWQQCIDRQREEAVRQSAPPRATNILSNNHRSNRRSTSTTLIQKDGAASHARGRHFQKHAGAVCGCWE